MSIEPIASYQGDDGDKWDLGRDLDSGRLYVLHRPAGSDPMIDYELDAFVARYRDTPQYAELMRQAELRGDEVHHA